MTDAAGRKIRARCENWSVTGESLPDFPDVFAAWHGKVRAYAAKLIGPGEADDVTQEVFLRVRRSLGTLEEPSKIGSWIYAITLNAVRDAVGKRSPRGAPPSAGAPEAIAAIPDAAARTPEEAVLRTEMVECYLDYVKRLPPRYEEVYVLSEFEELTNDEIAQRLAVSLGTVKIRLHRARRRLFSELRRNCACYVNDRGELMGAPKER